MRDPANAETGRNAYRKNFSVDRKNRTRRATLSSMDVRLWRVCANMI